MRGGEWYWGKMLDKDLWGKKLISKEGKGENSIFRHVEGPQLGKNNLVEVEMIEMHKYTPECV